MTYDKRETLKDWRNKNFIILGKDDSLMLMNFENILREVLWKERPYQQNNNNDDTDDDDNNDFNFQRHLLYINVDCLWPMFNFVIAVVVILRKY